MEHKVLGLHHITAIAGDAQRNHDFYTRILGLRLVKKTVNFDDPQTYHFYFGDRTGTPGTILTFFPWTRVRKGKNGAGMATEIAYSVPVGSLSFWKERFEEKGVMHGSISERFAEKQLLFTDPDGLVLKLVEVDGIVNAAAWDTEEIQPIYAIQGFHTVTLTLTAMKATAAILTDVFGYQFFRQEGNVYRYKTDSVDSAAYIDLLEDPSAPAGLNAGGTNHHIAFRVANEDALMAFREKVRSRGLQITEKIDRDYFFSLYFREPGGVLFEIATDNPGFDRDETLEELGSQLKLPRQYEAYREQIEKVLPVIQS